MKRFSIRLNGLTHKCVFSLMNIRRKTLKNPCFKNNNEEHFQVKPFIIDIEGLLMSVTTKLANQQ